ncbi:MAG: VRR-NUC domain-containing protein, partial [Ruminococcus sp.]|nr:VRR-NUC domain-containing protein [Candidatus Copronaster equi]
MNKQTINPSEAAEQEALFRWADFAKSKFPELEMMFHVPNEGKRSVANGASLKRQGLKKGVPDIFILAPKGKYHGMAIEMKKIGQKPTKEQKQFLAELEK